MRCADCEYSYTNDTMGAAEMCTNFYSNNFRLLGWSNSEKDHPECDELLNKMAASNTTRKGKMLL